MLSLVGGIFPADLLAWERANPADMQRLWTAAFVHWNGKHLAMNLAAVLLLGLLGAFARLPRPAAYAWLLSVPLTHAGLVYSEEIRLYAGLSGSLHAGVAVAAFCMIVEPSVQLARRPLGLLLAGGLALKILLEAPWVSGLQASPEWAFLVATAAHASGAVAGLLAAALLYLPPLLWRLTRARSRPPSI